MTTLADKARETLTHLTTTTRDNGERFTHWKYTAPSWCSNVSKVSVRDGLSHSVSLMDWGYQTMEEALDAIANEECADTDSARDISLGTDSSTNDLIRWLALSLNCVEFCDEASAEGIVSKDANLVDRITAGQYIAKQRVMNGVIDALESALTSADEEEDQASA